jgi:hypothetical protein
MRTFSVALAFLLLVSCNSKTPSPVKPEVTGEDMKTLTVTADNVMDGSLYFADYNREFNEVLQGKDSILASLIKIEIIDRKLFEQMQPTAVSFWEEDIKGALKIDTILTLKTRDSTLTFIDDTTDTEMHRTFTYEGRLPVINQFVVLGTYYEDYGYMLIDMNTGNTTATYQAFPLISPDKKYIISLYANFYDGESGELSIEKIEGDGAIIPLLNAGFTNWMPQETFFGTDGYLYASISHPSQYLRADGDARQYLRIKIL